MSVHNSYGLPLMLGVQVLPRKPWRLTSYLMIYNVQLRRLDINGSHKNQSPDREVWQERTHKHRWSERAGDTVAYTPDDIPVIPEANQLPEHYRGGFEAFCGELGVGLAGDYTWVDPPAGLTS